MAALVELKVLRNDDGGKRLRAPQRLIGFNAVSNVSI